MLQPKQAGAFGWALNEELSHCARILIVCSASALHDLDASRWPLNNPDMRSTWGYYPPPTRSAMSAKSPFSDPYSRPYMG